MVWTITGLWHGASWNYVGWGAYYGVLLLLEKFVWGRLLDRAPGFLRHLYTIGIFVFGWSFFWITDTHTLLRFWKALAFGYGLTGTSTFWELTVWEYWPVFVACGLAATPLVPLLKERLIAWAEGRKPKSIMVGGVADPRVVEARGLCSFETKPVSESRMTACRVAAVVLDLVLVLLLLASMASIVSGSFNPFIYFQF